MQLDVDAAAKEVYLLSDPELEKKTAATWAARAVACYQKFCETKDISWLLRCDRYRSEALEHAAQACDEGEVVREVGEVMARLMKEARR